MNQHTFVRYERRGNRVVPVRVTKQWMTVERPALGNRPAASVSRFAVVRVSELRRLPREQPDPTDNPPPPWTSGMTERVESRERLLTLSERGNEEGEPLVREAGYDQRWLPLGSLEGLTAAQAAWSLENNNGFRREYEAAP